MTKINEEKLKNITGGEISAWAVVGIISAVVFALGVVDGFIHPKGCDAWWKRLLIKN